MAIKTILALIIMPFVAGCAVNGWILDNTTTSYTRDFNNTPAGTKSCIITQHKIKEPVSRYDLYAEWSNGDLVTAASKAGITKIYYIDAHTFSILSGLYRKRDLIIYGD